MKRITGAVGTDLEEAAAKGDPDILVALTVIACRRAGAKWTEDDILDMRPGQIEFRDEPEEAPGPPGDAAEADPAPKRRTKTRAAAG